MLLLIGTLILITAAAGCGGGGGGSTPGRITVRSNLPNTGFVLDGVTYATNTAGEDATFPTATAKDYSFSCNAKSGYTVVASPTSAILVSGGNITFTCAYTVVATTTGIINVASNMAVTGFTLDGTHYFTNASGQYIFANANTGSHTFACDAMTNYTLVINQTSAILSNGSTINFTCLYTFIANPPANSGIITFYSNVAMDNNATVVCGGQTYTGKVTTDGGTVTLSTSAPAGTCSLTCDTKTGYTVTPNPSSAILAAGGSQQFMCSHTQVVAPTTHARIYVQADVAFPTGTTATVTGSGNTFTFTIGCDNCTYDLDNFTPKPIAGNYTLACPSGYIASPASANLANNDTFTFHCNKNSGGGVVWPPIE